MKTKYNKPLAMLLSVVMLFSFLPFSSVSASEKTDVELTNNELARKVAADGMVLMKNNGSLPLSSDDTVAIFGVNQIDYVRGGGGSGATNIEYQVTLLQGIQNKANEGKISFYEPLSTVYNQAYTDGYSNGNEYIVSDSVLQDTVNSANSAIITIGRYSAEGSDRHAGKGDYLLSDSEEAMIEQVCNAGFEKVIVVLNVGSAIDSTWFKNNDKIDSVLMAWQGGMEGGNAMADVLCGDVNPSGKLVDTFAAGYEDYPASETFFESNSYANYEEDIYVGYRYFETMPGMTDKVNYEFGFGLSYTAFDISNIDVSIVGSEAVIKADVTNTGSVSGKEVVQVYFSAPQGVLGKPTKELAAFSKTSELKPTETETVTMSFKLADMASYDDTGKTAYKSAYVMEAGNYKFYVGNSVRNVEESSTVYTLSEDVCIEQLSAQLVPTQLRRRLLANGTFEDFDVPIIEYKHTISANSVTKIEMEEFSNKHDTVLAQRFVYENGTIGQSIGYFNQGTWIEYDVIVEEAGNYTFGMSLSNWRAANINMATLEIDGDVQSDVVMYVPNTNTTTGYYDFVNIDDMFTIYLSAGEHTLRFTCNAHAAGPNIDFMYIETAPENPPVNIALNKQVEASSYANQNVAPANAVDGNYNTRWGSNYGAGDTDNAWLTVDLGDIYDVNKVRIVWEAAYAKEYKIQISYDNITFTNVVEHTKTNSNADVFNIQCSGRYIRMQSISAGTTYGSSIYEFEVYGNLANASVLSARNLAVPFNEESDTVIDLKDVYYNPELMGDFLGQFSTDELILLVGGNDSDVYQLSGTGYMGGLEAYGIPRVLTADGPAGVRLTVNATAFPISTLRACTWDINLLEAVGKAVAEECLAYGVDIWLAPGMNIHRDPLCGRNFEYYSEDPLLAGEMAAAITIGVQSKNVAVALKHFACNNKESNRTNSDSRVSERALREIYLKPFEIAVKKGDAWTIMSSYNLINGIETAESYDLLTNILRNEWGFDGLVMTDWGNNSNHYLELLAGNNIKMRNGDIAGLTKFVNSGGLTRETLESNVEVLLNVFMKLNSFQSKIGNPFYVNIGESTQFKAGKYVFGTSGYIRSQNCTDVGLGVNLGYCNAGEWTSYNINVETSGTYDLAARIASNVGAGSFDLLIDGEVIATYKAVNTGGWQIWTTLDSQSVHLDAGTHLMQINILENGLNINWLQFDLTSPDSIAWHEVLSDLITEAETLVGSDEYNSTYAFIREYFDSSLSNAKAVNNKLSSTEDELIDAWYQLVDAMGYLSAKPADTEKLTILVDLANRLDLTKYNTGVAAFETALANANALLADMFAGQDEVDSAYNTLLKAIAAMRYTVNKDMLQALYDSVSNKDLSIYTADSVAVLRIAMANALAVLNNEESTQGEVDLALAGLLEADDGLTPLTEESRVPSTDPSNTDTSSTPNKTATTDTSSSVGKQSAPKTGDYDSFILAVSLIGLAGALIVASKKQNYHSRPHKKG